MRIKKVKQGLGSFCLPVQSSASKSVFFAIILIGAIVYLNTSSKLPHFFQKRIVKSILTVSAIPVLILLLFPSLRLKLASETAGSNAQSPESKSNSSIQNILNDEKEEKVISLIGDIEYREFGETIHGYEKVDKGTSEISIYSPSTSFEPKQMKILIKLIQGNSHITSLKITYNDIDSKSIQVITEFLKTNSTLTSLDFSHNKIEDIGAECIASALEVNTSIAFLDLSSNDIGNVGTEHIASVLEMNTNITSLNLSYSSIGDIGVEHIARALKMNTKITSLNLSYNKVGDVGAEHIARALEVNTSITSLSFLWNNIGDVGIKYITRALEVNTSIASLNLSWNSIRDIGAEHIARALEVNTSITFLDLSSNDIGDVGVKCIIKALKENTTLTSIDLLTFRTDLKNYPINGLMERNEGYVSSLKEAVKEGNRSKAEELIKIGASPINRLGHFQSPFEFAMAKRNYPMIDLFLSKGFFFPYNSSREGICIFVKKLPRLFEPIDKLFQIYSIPLELVNIIISYYFDSSSVSKLMTRKR